MVNQTKPEKNKMNPLLWFFFAIVIPIIVVITLTIIIFSVAGVNVVDWAKNTGNNIPVISSWITTDEEEETIRIEEKMESTIANKDNEIEQLNQEVRALEAATEQLEQEIIKLENNQSSEETDNNDDTELVDSPVTTVSKSFKDMDSEQAALIFQSLEKELAVSILKELSNDVRGEIFEEMDPELAAELTQLFVN
ncbi:MotE family protein [Virgibacillus byunsanensis]|uniref:MotE family protein n=1 Tax=Virgibacillus byunsanensis TaxID=570945 RepID=A0ABW3LJ75_9BACI